jgi:hypothetical protein
MVATEFRPSVHLSSIPVNLVTALFDSDCIIL